jgi:lipopolysaccharide biosynthesis protein
MLMDVNTLATIQQNRHQELMRLAEQQRLVQTHNAKGNRRQAKATTGVKQTLTRASLQEKLFAMFQMRIRMVLPR